MTRQTRNFPSQHPRGPAQGQGWYLMQDLPHHIVPIRPRWQGPWTHSVPTTHRARDTDSRESRVMPRARALAVSVPGSSVKPAGTILHTRSTVLHTRSTRKWLLREHPRATSVPEVTGEVSHVPESRAPELESRRYSTATYSGHNLKLLSPLRGLRLWGVHAGS